MAQNGRHGLRGVSARNPSEFEGVQDDDDNLTYTVDMASYLGTDTISSVTRVPWGLTVSNSANTTTQITQRLKGFGYVDIKASLASGDVEKFRIYIVQRVPTATGTQDYIEVPIATTATRDPTTADDSTLNFVAGNLWINTVSLNKFTCISNTAGAARWRHEPRILGQGAGASITGTTNETALATVTIAAGTMGTNGRLTIDATWLYTNSGNNKTSRVRLGGISGTVFRGSAVTTTTNYRDFSFIQNQGSASDQIGGPVGPNALWNASTNALVDGAIDTSAETTLVFSGQLANSGESIELVQYQVTLTRPDIA